MQPRAIIEVSRVAARDLWHEWLLAACFGIALAAVLAPLLILFGLKSGIVDALTRELTEDPRVRELVGVGNHHLQQAWFDSVEHMPGVGFLLPKTRTLSSTLRLISANGGNGLQVEMVPTAPGDPLTNDHPPLTGERDIYLTHTAAERLGVGRGAEVQGEVLRMRETRYERMLVPLTVVDVLDERSFSRKAAFVRLPLLIATEDFRDGFAVPPWATEGRPRPVESPRVYSSFRLYAATLQDVAPLAAALRARGLDINTRAAAIARVLAIDHHLSFFFRIIALLGGGGYLIALAAIMWIQVGRKRRELAQLKVLGFPDASLLAFPLVQSVWIAIAGSLLAMLTSAALAAGLNQQFSGEMPLGGAVCAIGPVDYAAAGLLSVTFALAAALVAGLRTLAIEPGEALREI